MFKNEIEDVLMASSQEYQIDEPRLTSDFNEAKFQIYRLHKHWVTCETFRRRGQLVNWKWELDAIWDEISSKAVMCATKDRKYSKHITYLDGIIGHTEKFRMRTDLYLSLRAKQRYLKLLAEEVGLGGKFSSDQFEGMEE